MVKRGQAAIEFLTTYGWMFMIVLVVVGGLGYLGVFRPSNFVSDSCQFDATFACGAFRYFERAAGNDIFLDVQLTSNLPNDIRIDRMEIKLAELGSYCASDAVRDPADDSDMVDDDRVLRSRGTKEYRFRFNNGAAGCDYSTSGLDTRGKQRYQIRLEYVLVKETTQLPQIIPGSLVTEVLPE